MKIGLDWGIVHMVATFRMSSLNVGKEKELVEKELAKKRVNGLESMNRML
jgi:hypothetical protein